MSQNIRKYKTMSSSFPESSDMALTAYSNAIQNNEAQNNTSKDKSEYSIAA